MHRPSTLGEPAAEELLLGSFVHGLGQMFDALLIAPRVVDDQAALVFTEVNVRVVDVSGPLDLFLLGLFIGWLRVWSRSLIPGIFVHFVHNFALVLMDLP